MARSYWPGVARAAVSLTFDDARVTQIDNGLAILSRHGVHATFYLSPPAAEQRSAGWREAAAAGHEIGNHTLTHPCSGNFGFSRDHPLEEMSLTDMAGELDESSARIERLVGARPLTFAYPCGATYVGRGRDTRSYVPLVAERFVAGRGYLNGQTNDPERCDLAQLISVGLDRAPLAHVMDLIDVAEAEGSWLILTGHDIGADDEEPLSVEIPTLERVLGEVTTRGFWIAPVAEVARHIKQGGQNVQDRQA
jgi:peptidoglycan/xylan/chitin deacetylase (PgdA/CDA1 family)